MVECCQWLSTAYAVVKRYARSVKKEMVAIYSLYVRSYQGDLVLPQFFFCDQVLLSPLQHTLLAVRYTQASRLIIRNLKEFFLTSFLYCIEIIDERIWIKRVP